MFSMSGSELLSMIINKIPLSHLECDWEFWNLERDREFGIKVCQSIILSDSKTFSCLSFNNRSCLYVKAANWMWTRILCSCDFAYLILFLVMILFWYSIYFFDVLIYNLNNFWLRIWNFFGKKISSEFIV